MELSKEQKEAVGHGEGPLLIIAGAGTGKTTVITHRIAHLVISKRARPEEILALTFTDKAAQEMEERVDILIPYGYADITISTFHAFGDRVLRDNALDLGMRPDFRVLTYPEQIILFHEHLFEFGLEYYRPLSDPTRHIDALLKVISRARDEDVSPEEYLRYVEALESKRKGADAEFEELFLKQRDVARAYLKYQELKARHNFIDFGDQVSLTLKIFREHPGILKRYQERFKWILVDEFQDTNFAQFQILKLLAARHKNITVVADDDQSIYKWRGAAVSNILGFLDFYADAKKAVLKENYRSPQEILDTAYRLIRHNDPERLEARYGIDKKLKSMRGAGALPRFFIYDTLSTEADQVAEVIEKGMKDKGHKPGDFAILVRDNRDADPFLRSLNMKGIPWRFSGNRGLYAQEEVKVVISFLYTIADPHDSLNLFFLASSDLYRMNPIDLTDCMNAASRKNLSLFTVFKDMVSKGTVKISQEGMVCAAKIVEDIHSYIGMSQTMSAGQLLYRYLIDSGYLKKLTGSRSHRAAGQVQNISRFFEVVRAFEGLSPHDRVAQFVRHLDMLIEAGDDPATAEAEPDENAVNVLTVHKAKGLEFPIVFMVGLVTENFPTRKRGDPIELAFDLIKEPLPLGDIHLQEERRLFYVGMTRTREELFLTAARDYGGKRMRKVSPFVLEALDMAKVETPVQKASAEESIKRSAPPAQVSEGEAAYGPGAIPHLSYYQIDDYETCPLKYKFVHVLRVPIMSHHTVVYGKALHDAVQEYHRRKISGRPVSADDLIEVYKGSWRSEGFISREHEQMRFQAGERALRNFFASQEASGLLPTYVEKEFSFQVDGLSIKGRWDRVDVRDKEVSVIDFKSSEVSSQEDADKKTKDSLQLSLYALAYKTIYGKLPERVQLYFLESGLIGNAQKKEKDMDKLLGVIRDAASGIASRSYGASPGWHCRYCAYMIICEDAQR